MSPEIGFALVFGGLLGGCIMVLVVEWLRHKRWLARGWTWEQIEREEFRRLRKEEAKDGIYWSEKEKIWYSDETGFY